MYSAPVLVRIFILANLLNMKDLQSWWNCEKIVKVFPIKDDYFLINFSKKMINPMKNWVQKIFFEEIFIVFVISSDLTRTWLCKRQKKMYFQSVSNNSKFSNLSFSLTTREYFSMNDIREITKSATKQKYFLICLLRTF